MTIIYSPTKFFYNAPQFDVVRSPSKGDFCEAVRNIILIIVSYLGSSKQDPLTKARISANVNIFFFEIKTAPVPCIMQN